MFFEVVPISLSNVEVRHVVFASIIWSILSKYDEIVKFELSSQNIEKFGKPVFERKVLQHWLSTRTLSSFIVEFYYAVKWHHGGVAITTAYFHLTKTDLDFAQVQVVLTKCRRFVMVGGSDNDPG